MRRLVLILALVLIAATTVPLAASPVRAQTIPTPTLTVVVFGETNGTRQVFSPDQILIPQVPINLSVRFHNNEPTGGIDHSFTMDDENGTRWINTGLVAPTQNVTVNFTIVSITRIVLSNGTGFTPEAGPDGILFYCIPHRGTGVIGQGMVGQIILAGVQTGTATVEKGMLLRAYWIGMIGIAAMLLWIVITYFVIKSSSRHFADHTEHVRKGLP